MHSSAQSSPINISACFQDGPKMSILNLSLSANNEKELKKSAIAHLCQCSDPVERLKYICLSNSASAIKDVVRNLRLLCTQESKSDITVTDLINTFNACGVKITETEINLAFESLNKTQSENISLHKFLETFKPFLNKNRKTLLEKIFAHIDKDRKGYCTIEEMQSQYNYKRNPLYITGAKTKEEVFKEFCQSYNFDIQDEEKVTKEDFFNYYSSISTAVETDVYFDLVMRNFWDL